MRVDEAASKEIKKMFRDGVWKNQRLDWGEEKEATEKAKISY